MLKFLGKIDWFNRQLVQLKDTLAAWIKEAGHEVDVSEEEMNKKKKSAGRMLLLNMC